MLTKILALIYSYLYAFRHITNVPQTRGWEKKVADGPPCVVLASPGFMQVGPSRELFELWAPDARNGLVITGYSIEGTLAHVSSSGDAFFPYLHVLPSVPVHTNESKNNGHFSSSFRLERLCCLKMYRDANYKRIDLL